MSDYIPLFDVDFIIYACTNLDAGLASLLITETPATARNVWSLCIIVPEGNALCNELQR